MKKQVGLFLKEMAIKYETKLWDAMIAKLKERGKSPWIDDIK